MIDLKDISQIQDAVVTVMGLGRFKQGSGIGAAKWLMRHGAQIVVTDLKTEADLKASVDLVTDWYKAYREQYPDRAIYAPVFALGGHREDDFQNVQLVVKNPDVPKESAYVKLAEQNDVRVESDVSLFFHLYPHPIYAVTGTRGKSTTTALLGEMLKRLHPKAVVAGNIMHSPLEDLDWMLEDPKPVPIALEMSSWLLESLGHISRGPEIAIMTNVSRDHLDRYDSFESYIKAKELIFAHQSSSQKAVVNYDHELVRQIAERAASKKYWFCKHVLAEHLEGAFIGDDGHLVLRLNGHERGLCHVNTWPALQGVHNIENALGAALAASLAGVPDEAICETLRAFEGLPGREQTVREFDGVTYVNDTNATSPEGVMAALKRFGNADKNIVIIVGGKAKGFTFDEMAEEIRKTCKHVVYLEGSSTGEIEKAIGPSVPSSYAKSMDEAVFAARAAATSGDIVLLSPGTASFGLFKNAYDRGGQFVEAVKNLA